MSILKMCRKFGRAQDNFGKRVQINYRGKMTYGTALGGYISLLARIIIWTMALGEIWACFVKPHHQEAIMREQLISPNSQVYNISYE